MITFNPVPYAFPLGIILGCQLKSEISLQKKRKEKKLWGPPAPSATAPQPLNTHPTPMGSQQNHPAGDK